MAVVAALSGTALAKDILVLAEDVPATLNYDGPNASSPSTQMATMNLMEPLVFYKVKSLTPDGGKIYDYTQMEGRLAESFTYDAPSKTWTIKLRRDVKGCGGATFNADDVLYTMQRAKTVGGQAVTSWFLSNVASLDKFTPSLPGQFAAWRNIQRQNLPADFVEVPGVTPQQISSLANGDIKTRQALAEAPVEKVVATLRVSNEAAQKIIDTAKGTERVAKVDETKLGDEVKKIDDYTVQFRLAADNHLLLPVFTIFALLMFDKEGMEKAATADDPYSHAYANTTAIHSFGPYCMEKWEKDKEFTLAANVPYYGGKADIDRVLIRKIPQSSQRVTILRTGQAHLAENLTYREFDSLRGARGVKVVSAEANAGTVFYMNWGTKPFDNLDLRKAIAYAMPRDQIVKDVYQGQAVKANGVMLSFFPGYAETGVVYEQDMAKAKEHLAKAGYPDGKGLEAFPNAFLLSYPSEREPIVGPAATIIASAMQQIGIPMKLNPMPMNQFTDKNTVKKELEMSILDFSKSIGIDGNYATQLFYITPAKGGISNYSRYSNDFVDNSYFQQAKNELDTTKRNATLFAIQKKLMEDVVVIPITENKIQWAMSDKLSGATAYPELSLRYYDLKLAQ
jgi:peptide/nickel transport system substrate-binding protein